MIKISYQLYMYLFHQFQEDKHDSKVRNKIN